MQLWLSYKSSKYHTFQVCMSVALVIQHPKRMRRNTVICGLYGSAVFFHIFS